MLVEYGSGSSMKTRLLLEKLLRPVAYVPVDISGEYLASVATSLETDYPAIEVLPLCADFTRPLDLPQPAREAARHIVYFPGSTIGNFSRDVAVELLQQMRDEAGDDGGLLIGVDLVKPRDTLERAYNDAAGVTAEFNLNLLRRLNREFGSDFNIGAFRHRAVYDDIEQRIEMRLVSLNRQTVHMDGAAIRLEPGEYIVTEHSHKYSTESFAVLAAQAGFRVEAVWTDPAALFSVQYLAAA
jgi:dimethylhistidine N-methyltransferase